MTTAILIVGHGSRDAAANAELDALVADYRAARPGLEIAVAFVELADPPLRRALRALAGRAEHIVVVPLFLFAAGHVKNDIPLALEQTRRENPGVEISAARALGVHPALVELAYRRAEEAAGPPSPRTALVVVGRGSSDPDANGDFCKLVRLVGEGRGFSWVVPSFIGITSPLVADAIELVVRARPERIIVVPYLLFAGRLIDKLAADVETFRRRYPWVPITLAAHLGADAGVRALLDERVAEATEGARPLPCDTCQYRIPVSGVAGHVGGLKALLYSVRHAYTHTQAMPHIHAHAPLARHVLVCTNADCAERGSVKLLGTLRRLVKAAGRERDIRVTRTLCMGRCGEGPTVAVYPDGIWYRGVADADAAELVEEHLLGDRLVRRLVDSIMQ